MATRVAGPATRSVAALRQVGFRDDEIFEIVMVTAYYALRCRMADGLGVDVDSRARQDAVLVDAFSYRAGIGHA